MAGLTLKVLETEDKAPRGCDLSAASSAGMAVGGFDAGATPNSKSDRRGLTCCGLRMALTGVSSRADTLLTNLNDAPGPANRENLAGILRQANKG